MKRTKKRDAAGDKNGMEGTRINEKRAAFFIIIITSPSPAVSISAEKMAVRGGGGHTTILFTFRFSRFFLSSIFPVSLLRFWCQSEVERPTEKTFIHSLPIFRVKSCSDNKKILLCNEEREPFLF